MPKLVHRIAEVAALRSLAKHDSRIEVVSLTTGFAIERITQGDTMVGLFIVHQEGVALLTRAIMASNELRAGLYGCQPAFTADQRSASNSDHSMMP